MARKKQSAVAQEYRRQRRRIQNAISRYRRQGFDVQYALPSIPKKITAASVHRLSKITTAQIQSKTYGINFETGERVAYRKVRQAERNVSRETKKFRNQIQNAVKKNRKQIETKQPQVAQVSAPTDLPDLADIIIGNFRLYVSYYPDAAKEITLRWLNNLLSTNDKNDVAQMLQQANENGLWLEPKEVYDSEKLYAALADMLDFLEVSGEEKKQILNDIESDLDFSEY